MDVKQHFNNWNLLPVKDWALLMMMIELRSCVKVEVDVLGSRPYARISVDVKQHFNNNNMMMMMWDLMSSNVGLTY